MLEAKVGTWHSWKRWRFTVLSLHQFGYLLRTQALQALRAQALQALRAQALQALRAQALYIAFKSIEIIAFKSPGDIIASKSPGIIATKSPGIIAIRSHPSSLAAVNLGRLVNPCNVIQVTVRVCRD